MQENVVLILFLLAPAITGFLLYRFFAKSRVHKRPTTVLRLISGNLLVLAFLVSILLIGGEAYYRVWYDATDSFGLAKVTQRWFDRHYVKNSQGFRDQVEYESKPAQGKMRITFLGDSFTAGHGVKNVKNRFANRIRASIEDLAEVHVIARNGWETGHELQVLTNMPPEYECDFIVLVYCLNDVADILVERKEVYYRIYQESEPGFLAKNSYLLNTWHYRIFAANDPDVSNYYQFTIDGYKGSAWELQKSRLEQLKDLVQRREDQLLVVTFPFLHALGEDYEYQGIHDQLDAFWKDLGVSHLDLLDAFRDYDPRDIVVSSFDAHPNEHAHALASKEILQFLEANGVR